MAPQHKYWTDPKDRLANKLFGQSSTIVTSKITDHHNKYNNHRNACNISRFTKYDKDEQRWANAIEENGASRLAGYEVATNPQFVKSTLPVMRSKVKHSEVSCDCKDLKMNAQSSIAHGHKNQKELKRQVVKG